MNARQRTGRLGEQIAKRHLQDLGYIVLEMNYRAKGGEIDLIAEKGEEIIFVEVKTRRGGRFGLPEESVTASKQEHIVAAAQEYLQSTGNEMRDWRVDVVAIVLNGADEPAQVNHIENAVQF